MQSEANVGNDLSVQPFSAQHVDNMSNSQDRRLAIDLLQNEAPIMKGDRGAAIALLQCLESQPCWFLRHKRKTSGCQLAKTNASLRRIDLHKECLRYFVASTT